MAIAFSILMFCSILLSNTGIILASEPGYQLTEPYVTSAVTVDGNWVGAEWSDAWIEYIDPYDARFAYKMDTNAGPYLMSWLVEFPDDTDNATDMWQICIDGPQDALEGTAPDANDVKIEIEGHTTLKVYNGDGQGWVQNETAETAITWAESLTTTSSWAPYNEPHYVLEVQVNKGELGTWGASSPPHGLRVAMYDASNESQGWIAWPPTDPDDPYHWGLIFDFAESIPESLGIMFIVLLSSVAIAISLYFLRKTPKSKVIAYTRQETNYRYRT